MPDAGKVSITPGTLHHVELQMLDLFAATRSFGWLLTELGYAQYQAWNGGRSWKHLYADRHPWADGKGHYAVFIESGERFKVELVATTD